MNLIKFGFLVPFLFLISTESLPVAQPPIIPSHVVHIRKDFPGIISFGPIFINSVKRGIFTDQVSIHPFPCGSNPCSVNLPLVDCNEKPDTQEVIEVEQPLEFISEEENKPDEENGGELNDLVSDYHDFLNKSTLTSGEIYWIQMADLEKIRQKELNAEFEILNQVNDVQDEFEPEIPNHNNYYEHVGNSQPGYPPYVPQRPEMEPQPQKNPEPQEYEHYPPKPQFDNNFGGPQTYPIQPYEPMYPVYPTIKPENPASGPFYPIPEGIYNQKPQIVEESSMEPTIWDGPTSPEVAQSVYEYINNHKPGEIPLCPPKDSSQISQRHDTFAKG